MFNILFFISLLVVGYFTGRAIEKKHYASILQREKTFRHIPLISGQWKNQLLENDDVQIFGGSVVVGADYFKSVVANLRGFFGGRLTTYESLLDRGRREALLRMQKKALDWGADKVINVRVETAVIGNASGNQALPCVEVYAYGTAVKHNSHAV